MLRYPPLSEAETDSNKGAAWIEETMDPTWRFMPHHHPYFTLSPNGVHHVAAKYIWSTKQTQGSSCFIEPDQHRISHRTTSSKANDLGNVPITSLRIPTGGLSREVDRCISMPCILNFGLYLPYICRTRGAMPRRLVPLTCPPLVFLKTNCVTTKDGGVQDLSAKKARWRMASTDQDPYIRSSHQVNRGLSTPPKTLE